MRNIIYIYRCRVSNYSLCITLLLKSSFKIVRYLVSHTLPRIATLYLGYKKGKSELLFCTGDVGTTLWRDNILCPIIDCIMERLICMCYINLSTCSYSFHNYFCQRIFTVNVKTFCVQRNRNSCNINYQFCQMVSPFLDLYKEPTLGEITKYSVSVSLSNKLV